MLEDLGVAPEKRSEASKRPTLKVVATMVLAGCKMKRMAGEWSQQKKMRASLAKALDGGKAREKLKWKGAVR